jgi:two-component sensor histidine kinase
MDELRQAMHPEDRHLLAQFHALTESQDSFPAEYRIVKADGKVSWLSGYGRVLDRQANGKAHHVIHVATDITERKTAEAHQRFLLQELSHRSKNLLSIVQAVADQTMRNCPDLAEFQKRFDGRLQGLAASNTLLARGDWRGSCLSALVELQLSPFIDLASPQIEVRGPNVDLTAEATQAVGLALHELATNAVKHGALSVPQGRVSVSWEVFKGSGAPRLRLDWTERDGPPVTAPNRTGFGHFVIKTMIEQSVQGKVALDFNREGLHWSLEAPATVFLK